MTLHGKSLINGKSVAGTDGETAGVDPTSNETLEPPYTLISSEQLREATTAAADAYPSFSALSPSARAAFLNTIADNIEAIGDELIARAGAETGLPAARLTGERARTCNQLRLFADVVIRGDFYGVRIDPALPDRKPLPRADIRHYQRPLGPVAVFGASNFPLAFSTAGGDTASALAAGSPVVFKAHNAHPGTSELVGHAIASAVAQHNLHPGVFSLVFGRGADIGQALVADPVIKAVGFTGSRSAGIALMRTAAARPVPIPVYAEMSSINPVFVFPGALEGDIDSLAQQYITSVTGSSGQLCTSPGLLFAPTGNAGDRLVAAVADAVQKCTGQTMLTPHIAAAWQRGTNDLESVETVEVVARGEDGPTLNAPAPTIFGAGLTEFVDNAALHAEIFGAASLVIRYDAASDLVTAINALEGQLTATLHLTDDDHVDVAPLLPLLEETVGRIIVNGWPTGVEVGHAVVHGGPFPATSDSRTTSVGSLAIERFLRPVAYQDTPQPLLPPPLQDSNPWGLSRRIDGVVVSAR
ncbi:aldehyde dehydrogenase (NADP(+)) [Rhodococcoides kyotonense]|uniref:NADP-dependent aldehyde dehydrogenase n=1 Tax=Rhodococcoides kyotonense TaxID=398843 RepID=A0A239MYK8_9NOCA|nr:aldehyde dehydrogenase (NADP(+)) [Rhodococcus kyotonensis]SNT47796.1 NADP-dependent aldehyde dehydrogenase [Rhodococcus kyotonensis]